MGAIGIMGHLVKTAAPSFLREKNNNSLINFINQSAKSRNTKLIKMTSKTPGVVNANHPYALYGFIKRLSACLLVFLIAVNGGLSISLFQAILGKASLVHATTFSNDYPDGDAMVKNLPTYDWWKDENGDGQYSGSAELYSSRGYGYRNCTDGVAYWVNKYTGITVPTNLGNALSWDDNAPSAYSVKSGTGDDIEPGDIAQSDDGTYGHVGFVTEVIKNDVGAVTQFKTAELNKAGDGNYSSNTYTTRVSGKFTRGSSGDWDHFIDVNGAGKGLNNEVIAGGASGSITLARPAAISFNGALNVFTRGGDGQIYNQYWNGTSWTGFSSIGGNMISDPAVIVNGTALNVFALNQDGQIYTKYNDGTGWSGWSSLGSTTMRGNPRVVIYGAELDVFALGADNHPYKDTWQSSSGWGGWGSLGNYMDSSPSVLQYGSELDVVMRGTDNHIYKDTWSGSSWGGFGDLGCCLVGNPDTISYSGQLDIWSNAPSPNHIWKRTWSGSSWGSWTDMGGPYAGDPDVMQYNSDLNVFVRGTDGQMYTRYWSASGSYWSGWASVGGTIAGDPTAIQYGTELTIFATGTDGKTYKNTFLPSSGWGTFAALPG